jgi:DNA-binding transcriptional ArsR family regulator
MIERRFGVARTMRNHMESRSASRDRASVDVYRAIADPTRRAILDRLRAGPAPVNALAGEFEQSRPAISKHLRVLRDARLVSETRAGRERLYELRPVPLQQVAGWVEGYRGFWQMSLTNLKKRLEEER